MALAGAAEGRGRDPFAERAPLPGVRHVIAVSSAKGGVGKSTVAANLAVALAEIAQGVGLADMDVYGPSLPIMFGLNERPEVTADRRIRPPERHGVKLMSMGFFLDERSPVIWRGPIVMGIVRQFLQDVDWAPLDFLVIDLPPGTGRRRSSPWCSRCGSTGGIVVTTPQDVALLDVGRGIAMFRQVSTPVLGVVENMTGYVCPSCGTEDPVFGTGGAERLAAHFGVPLLAQHPPRAGHPRRRGPGTADRARRARPAGGAHVPGAGGPHRRDGPAWRRAPEPRRTDETRAARPCRRLSSLQARCRFRAPCPR